MNTPKAADAITQLTKEFEDEYRELSEDWRAIDHKADGAMRFAATLLAATAAVVFRSDWNSQHFVANLLGRNSHISMPQLCHIADFAQSRRGIR